MSKIGIYGASGHGKVVADIAKALGYEVIFIDDAKEGYIDYTTYKARYNYPLAWGIGDNLTRWKLAQTIQSEVITLIHPSAIVSQSAKIKRGVVIMPGAIVNADTTIHEGAIINSGAIIEHDSTIGRYCHIAPNAALAGGVSIGELTFVGIGSTIIQRCSIGSHTIIGAGSLVLDDIPPHVIAYGSPAKIRRSL
ncbi:MAG: acetyltransferase [Nitratiruptor sp.]|nr:acetyltransferase [Nitratiruptor sp.]NPA84030.1 acetyltransferase [Campylobacterota bacterium]